jgi:putative transcriptional regulator
MGELRAEVRRAREERGWTQGELAARVGVSRQTINYLEQERYQPSVLLALKLARAFRCQVEDLFVLQEDADADGA